MPKRSVDSLLRNLPFKLSNSRMVVSYLNRHGQTYSNTSMVINSPSEVLESQSHTRAGQSVDGQHAGNVEIKNNLIAPDNPDPEKNVIPDLRPLKGWHRFFHRLVYWPARLLKSIRPERTPEQIEVLEQEKWDRDFLKIKSRELRSFARLIINHLSQQGFQNIVSREGSKRRVNLIHPDMIVSDRGAKKYTVSLHVDSLPQGVKLTEIVNQVTMTEISPSVHMNLKGELDLAGVRIIGYPSGEKGLPTFVGIGDVWKKTPDNQPPLTFPIGIGENGHPFYKDLAACPHLMVVGGSNQGKSNFINVILCTYLRKLTPEKVQFVLFDLKRGMEFHLFDDKIKGKSLPHLFVDPENNIPGIVEDLDQAIEAMKGIRVVMEKRMDQIKWAGFKNIIEYNMGAKRKKIDPIPYLVIVFDEYSQIGLMFGDVADKLIARISNMGRAAGVHIIIGAQYAKAEVITTLATINFQVRVAFNMQPGASQSAIGNWNAVGMSCQGRAILQDFDKSEEVQTPRITDATIRAIVKNSIEGRLTSKGETGEKASKLDIEEVLKYALETHEGKLEVKPMYDHFRGQIGFKRLVSMLKEADECTYVIGDTTYLVTQSIGRSRRMIIPDKD